MLFLFVLYVTRLIISESRYASSFVITMSEVGTEPAVYNILFYFALLGEIQNLPKATRTVITTSVARLPSVATVLYLFIIFFLHSSRVLPVNGC